MTYTAKIRAKGLDGTGVDEETAKTMYSNMGGATLAIVELEHVERHDVSSGDHMVHLMIGFCEPIPDEHEDMIRTFHRSLYRDRRAAAGDAIPGVDDDRRTTSDVAGEIAANTEPDDGPEWDGSTDGSGKDEPTLAGPGAGDPAFDVHAFLPGTTDPKLCAVDGCGKGPRAKIHKVES